MRRRHRLALSSIFMSFVAQVGSGCSDEPTFAERQDPASFSASSETKNDLGIAKWAFTTEAGSDTMTYRGYDENDAVVATVVQTLDRSDPNRYVSRLLMQGRVTSASETIEFFTQPSDDDGEKTVVMMKVTENTFEEGAIPSRVLFRFKADAMVRKSLAGGSSSLLVGRSRPLDEPTQLTSGDSQTAKGGQQDLVTRCNDTREKCQVALIDQRIAAAGEASECSLLKRVNVPLMEAGVGAGVGLLYSWWTGPLAAGPVLVGAGAGAAAGIASQSVQCASSRREASMADQKHKDCKKEQDSTCAGGASAPPSP